MAFKHPFVKAFGSPDPAAPVGIRLKGRLPQKAWEQTVRLTGAGYFMNRFLFLFGEGLDRLHACLEAWSFLVPPAKGNRIIVGYNAYGSLLVLEDASTTTGQVHLLDPFRVVYFKLGSASLLNLVSNWLPYRLVPHFLDDELYQSWVAGDEYLPEGYVLAAQKPEGLGGELVESNVQGEEIVSYYQTTGPIYAKATAKKPAAAKKPAPRKRR